MFFSLLRLARARSPCEKIGSAARSREHRFPAHPIRNAPASKLFLRHVAPSVYQRYRNDARKTAGARREPIFFTLAVHTLHPLFSTTRGFADKSRRLFSPKIQTTNRSSAPGLSDISLHHVLSRAAHATPHASRARASGCKTLANKPTEEQKQWTAPSSKQKFSVAAADRS